MIPRPFNPDVATRRLGHVLHDKVFTGLAIAALLEIVWTILLASRLPHHYTVEHWDVAWVGLDVSQTLMLLGAAWAAWRRRALLILFASSAATLLLVDAWFDVTTARYRDLAQSVLGLLVEIPAALVLFWITWRAIRQLANSFSLDPSLAMMSVRKIPLGARSSVVDESLTL